MSTADLECIEIAVEALSRARTELDAAVLAACPGPHEPLQHRDDLPPWCHACGRTGDGLRVKEVTS